jgi:hypothetical protein
MPVNPNDPQITPRVGQGGGVVTGTPFPTPPSVSGSDSPFIVIQKYRAAMAKFVGDFYLGIGSYVDDFARIAKPSYYRDSELQPATADDLAARQALLDSSQNLLTQSDPIIATMLQIMQDQLITNRPDLDIQALVDKIIAVIDLELDSNEDVEIFRGLLKALVSAVMLDSAFNLLSADTNEITTIVNGFKTTIQTKIEAQFTGLDNQTLTGINTVIDNFKTAVKNQIEDEFDGLDTPTESDVNAIVGDFKTETKTHLDSQFGSLAIPTSTGIDSIVNGFKTEAESHLEGEFADLANQTSAGIDAIAENFRTPAKVQLTGQFTGLGGQTAAEINTIVNNFKIEAKSQLDDQMFEIGTQALNVLIARGILLSDPGAESIARIQARKGRQYTEIDAKAEQLRADLLNAAYNRALEKGKQFTDIDSRAEQIRIDLLTMAYNVALEKARLYEQIDAKTEDIRVALLTMAHNVAIEREKLYTEIYEKTEDIRVSLLTLAYSTAVEKGKLYAEIYEKMEDLRLGLQTMAYNVAIEKAKQYMEIYEKMEDLRTALLTAAYERAFERWRIRVSAHQTIPTDLFRLSPTLTQILDTLVNKMFPDPVQFLNQLPNLLGQGLSSLAELARILQDERFKKLSGDSLADGNLNILLRTIGEVLGNVGTGLGKLGTFEAS